MTNIKITRHYKTISSNIAPSSFKYDKSSARPSWIYIKDKKFNSRFLSVTTKDNTEILYKRFTGNFYYPVDLIIREQDESKFYDAYAKSYDKNTLKNNLPLAKFLLNMIKKIGIAKEAKILDAGAGTGIFSDLARKSGFKNLILLDINKSMLNVAKTKAGLKDMKYLLGDIVKIRIPVTLDSVVSIMLFDKLSDESLEKALENINKKLVKNGYVFLIEDNKRAVYSKYFNLVKDGFYTNPNLKHLIKYYFIGKKKS